MASSGRGPPSCTVHVPESLVGQLIGKKGANIKEINQRSGARCWVDNTRVIHGCKVLEISGNDGKSVAMAKQIVESQLGHFKQQNSGAERENIPGMGGIRKGKKQKKKGKRKGNQEFVESDPEDMYQSEEDEEEKETGFQRNQEPKSNSNFGSYCNHQKPNASSSNQTNDEEEKTRKEEERRRKAREMDWDLYEADNWVSNNMWGLEGSKTYSVGSASTFVCSKTGRVEMLPYQRQAEIGTSCFKRFKEQLLNEKYDTWKEQGGDDWRNLMMKGDKLMEKSLCKSVAHYNAAFLGAVYSKEIGTARSLARNLLVSFTYLAPRVRESCRMDIYCEAVHVFKTVVELCGRDQEWLYSSDGNRKGVVDFINDIVEEVGVLLPSLDMKTREMVQVGETFVAKFGRWPSCDEERNCTGIARLRQGEAMFNKAAMAMGDKNFVDALYLLQELYTVVEEAKRLLQFPDDGETDDIESEDDHYLRHLRDLKLLITDIRIHTSLAEALKAVHDGDATLKEAIEGYENLQLDLVYSALDKYRLAVTLARGEDIEIMCIAFTKIASVYINVFKDGIHKTKGKEYLNNVLDLSKVIQGNLYTAEWYKEATLFLKNMQDEKQQQEDELWQNQRKVFMDQLSDETKTLELHKCDSDSEFLVFLFAKFPPKHRPEGDWKHLLPKEGEDDMGTWKKTMMKLVTIYHPDRVDKTVHSSKYHVLCEEITKELTNRYNKFK